MHGGAQTLQGYERFGFTRAGAATVYREWAPAATAAQLIGDFNGWAGTPLQRDAQGVWSVTLPDGAAAPPAGGWGGWVGRRAGCRRWPWQAWLSRAGQR
jgi:hypothetical protein